jgi:putative DNA primase/helicase
MEQRGRCLLHEGTRDSFAINADNGLWMCHSCGRNGDLVQLERELSGSDYAGAVAEILKIVGRPGVPDACQGRSGPRASIVAEYDYLDETGRTLYQTVRYDPKSFKQRRPDGKGGWCWSLRGARLVLYRLPQLLARPSDVVFVCEGEKDVQALESRGLLVTCNPMGAGKWRDEYSETLKGRLCPGPYARNGVSDNVLTRLSHAWRFLSPSK